MRIKKVFLHITAFLIYITIVSAIPIFLFWIDEGLALCGLMISNSILLRQENLTIF
jgi:hypothetical protein